MVGCHERLALGVRGPEWSRNLRNRIDAPTHFIGIRVSTVMIANESQTTTIQLDPKMQKFFYVEVI